MQSNKENKMNSNIHQLIFLFFFICSCITREQQFQQEQIKKNKTEQLVKDYVKEMKLTSIVVICAGIIYNNDDRYWWNRCDVKTEIGILPLMCNKDYCRLE